MRPRRGWFQVDVIIRSDAQNNPQLGGDQAHISKCTLPSSRLQRCGNLLLQHFYPYLTITMELMMIQNYAMQTKKTFCEFVYVVSRFRFSISCNASRNLKQFSGLFRLLHFRVVSFKCEWRNFHRWYDNRSFSFSVKNKKFSTIISSWVKSSSSHDECF